MKERGRILSLQNLTLSLSVLLGVFQRFNVIKECLFKRKANTFLILKRQLMLMKTF